MKEDRVAKAIALFKEGYNCSQSVVAAFADEYGFRPVPTTDFRIISSGTIVIPIQSKAILQLIPTPCPMT